MGAVGCREGDKQGPLAHKALEGSHKSPAAQGPFAPCAGSILWSEGCSDTERRKDWGFAMWPTKNSHPHLLLDEKKAFRCLSAGVLPSERLFCHSGHS